MVTKDILFAVTMDTLFMVIMDTLFCHSLFLPLEHAVAFNLENVF